MKPKNNKIKAISIGILSIVMFLFVVNSASAALVQCGGTNDNGTPQEACSLSSLVKTTVNVINYLLAWSWLIAIFFIMWAGWGFINAGGNQEKITEAKSTFTSAIIGFFLVIASYVLLNAIVWALVSGNPTNKLPIKTIFDFLK